MLRDPGVVLFLVSFGLVVACVAWLAYRGVTLSQIVGMFSREAAVKEPPASVPFMITKAMRRRLRDRGFTDEEIDKTTPLEAWKLLSQ